MSDAPGEQVLYSEHPAMFRNQPVGFVLAVILCLVGIGFVILLVWWLRCLGTRLSVSDRRTTLRTGLLSKNTNEVWHASVRNIQIRQSFLQRIFGVGFIGISSAAQAGMEIEVAGIRDPEGVRAIIDRYRV